VLASLVRPQARTHQMPQRATSPVSAPRQSMTLPPSSLSLLPTVDPARRPWWRGATIAAGACAGSTGGGKPAHGGYSSGCTLSPSGSGGSAPYLPAVDLRLRWRICSPGSGSVWGCHVPNGAGPTRPQLAAAQQRVLDLAMAARPLSLSLSVVDAKCPRQRSAGFGLSNGFWGSASFSFGDGFSPELASERFWVLGSGFGFGGLDTPPDPNPPRCHP
jgi:hypothetical protein